MSRSSAPPPPEDTAEPDRPNFAGPDPAAILGRLFDQHADPLHRYLARRVGQATAQDLVAETFLTAFRQRHTYDAARAGARAWLYGIASNLLRRHVRTELRALRATARLAGGHDQHTDGHAERVAERVDAQSRVGQLADALTRLSEEDREVLLLSAWAGLNTVEIAETLNIPAGTVRSRLHRVRRWLRANAPAELTTAKDDDTND
jgi:RNA polymerase sigma-70 factor (ECF subfamily)